MQLFEDTTLAHATSPGEKEGGPATAAQGFPKLVRQILSAYEERITQFQDEARRIGILDLPRPLLRALHIFLLAPGSSVPLVHHIVQLTIEGSFTKGVQWIDFLQIMLHAFQGIVARLPIETRIVADRIATGIVQMAKHLCHKMVGLPYLRWQHSREAKMSATDIAQTAAHT